MNAHAMAQAHVERRRPLLQRTEVRLRAKLFREGEPELDVRLRNVSSAGFMAECLMPIPPGSNVVLSVPGIGRIPAEIRWNESFRLGGLFTYELSAKELGVLADPAA